MAKSLYTQQSLIHLGKAGFGNPRLLTPPGFHIIAWILLFTLVLGIYLLATQTYLRKATVQGYLFSKTVRIAPERIGTLSHLLVTEGQYVYEGAPLAVIRSQVATAIDDDRNYDALLLAADQQLENVQHLLLQEMSRLNAAEVRLNKSRKSLKMISQIQQTRIRRFAERLNKATPLQRQGFLSILELSLFEDQLLNARQREQELTLELARNRSDLAQVKIEKQDATTRSDLKIIEITEKKIHLTQAREQWFASREQTLTTPADGQISKILKFPGETVAPKESLLILTSTGDPIYVRLLIPDQAIGFIRAGQPVNLQYDAYPHTQFGTHPGEVLSITDHPIHPQDLPFEIPLEGTFYLANVALVKQTITAYGNELKLKPGMSVRANIILERRSLLAWLLEPLLAARGSYV